MANRSLPTLPAPARSVKVTGAFASSREPVTCSCSEEVLLPDFGRRVELADGELVLVDFIADRAGDYAFTSRIGDLHGTIIAR